MASPSEPGPTRTTVTPGDRTRRLERLKEQALTRPARPS